VPADHGLESTLAGFAPLGRGAESLADGYLARPVPVDASPIPQNPSISPDPWSAIHNDTYMSDTYRSSGVLGSRPVVSST
jgi:hypothetical protein